MQLEHPGLVDERKYKNVVVAAKELVVSNCLVLISCFPTISLPRSEVWPERINA